MDTKYNQFVRYLFDRDESKGDWRFEWDDEEIDISDFDAGDIVKFIARMLSNYEKDLKQYTDWQLGMGLDYIFNNACSGLSSYLIDSSIGLAERLKAILALKAFFSDCLNKRCIPALAHLSEQGNKLNSFCYMLWDYTSLPFAGGDAEGTSISSAVIDVMEYSLSLDNIACIESGLHGLGHMEGFNKDAPRVVRRFINANPDADSRLLKYARNAERGYVL